eukprot:856885_1
MCDKTCDKRHCAVNGEILIPEAIEFGGSIFWGYSPISKQWLIIRFIFFIISLLLLIWSLTYHILNHRLLEWIYWMNNWTLLLSVIYPLISFIVTYKISLFVNKQHSKLSNISPYNIKKSNMMNETTSFALKSPNTKKYKSVAQHDEDSINNVDESVSIGPKSVSIGMSIDDNGIDKRNDLNILLND